ncbi:MAG: hypothetical protein AB7S68_33320 [Polyangiaceae bacterium]
MSGQLLSSKVVIVEEEPRVRGIPSAPTSVAGAVGITERGPVGQAVLCSSFDEFQDKFGGFTVDADLPLTAMGFFENGGSQLWVVRTMHYGDVSDPSSELGMRASGFLAAGGGPAPASVQGATSGPFRLTDGSLIRAVVDGGAPQDAVFIGSAATVAAGGARPFALADGMNLLLRFDGGAEQEVVFAAADFNNIALATPPEVAALLNRVLVGARASVTAGILQVQSDTLGLASQAQIVGGTANTVLQFPDATVSGGGNVPNLAAVDVLDVRAVVEAAIPTLHVVEGPGGQVVLETVGTGPTANLEVDAATSAAFGLDAALHTGAATGAAQAIQIGGRDPGVYGNRVEVEVRAATNGSADAFDLLVIEDGVYREVFPNLSMTEAHPRYVETVINDARAGSLYIGVTDQRLAGTPVPHPQTIALSGGNDGLLGLGDADFIGSEAGHTGLHALDAVQDLSLLVVPGRATPAVHDAMLRYCEVTRNGMAFAVLEPPAGLSAPDIVTFVTTTASLENLSSTAAATGRVSWSWTRRRAFSGTPSASWRLPRVRSRVRTRVPTVNGLVVSTTRQRASTRVGSSECWASRPTRCSTSASATWFIRTESTRSRPRLACHDTSTGPGR